MFNYFLACFQKTEKQFDDGRNFKMDVLLLCQIQIYDIDDVYEQKLLSI